MATCGNCGHQKHLHTLGLGRCKANGCSCWSFINALKQLFKKG